MTNTTTPTATASAATDPRDLFAIARATVAPLIEAMTADQLDLPTPCPGFTVRELLGHMLVVLDRPTILAAGRDPMEIADATFVADDEWAGAWAERSAAVAAAWTDDSLLAIPVHLPWADINGAQALVMWTGDLTAHTWDLASALGRLGEVTFDDRVVGASLASLKGMLPSAERGAMWEQFAAGMPPEVRDHFQPPFADATPLAADAALIDQLVAWSGRTP